MLCGIGDCLNCSCFSLMLTTFQDLLVQVNVKRTIWLIVTGVVEAVSVIAAKVIWLYDVSLPIQYERFFAEFHRIALSSKRQLPVFPLHGSFRVVIARFEWYRTCIDCSFIWSNTGHGCQYFLK